MELSFGINTLKIIRMLENNMITAVTHPIRCTDEIGFISIFPLKTNLPELT